MCLDFVEQYDYVESEGLVGFKVGTVENGIFTSADMGYKCPINTWVTDHNEERIESSFSGIYRSGFHIFACIEAAKLWCDLLGHRNKIIVQVRFRSVVASGRQFGAWVVVARELYIEF